MILFSKINYPRYLNHKLQNMDYPMSFVWINVNCAATVETLISYAKQHIIINFGIIKTLLSFSIHRLQL